MIYVIATLDLRPGSAGAVKKAARPLVAETLREQGCLAYELCQSDDNPDRLVFVERWESREDLERHFTEPHLAEFSRTVKSYMQNERVEIIEADSVEVI